MARSVRLLALALALAVVGCSGTAAPEPSSTTTTTVVTATTTTTTPQPAYVPAECSGQAVTTTAPGATTTTVARTDLSAAEQADVLDALDATVRDRYVYPDFNGADWPGEVAALAADVAAGLDTATFYERIQALITSLGDEHSYFLDPVTRQEEDAQIAGQEDLVGIGVLALPVDEEQLVTILSVFPDSGAEHAGIQVHDGIVAIDGVALGPDPGRAGRNLRGPACSLVVLTVRSPGGAERTVAAVRLGIGGGVPITTRLVTTPDGRSIGYVYLPTLFDQTIADQVRSALDAWGPLDGLILDLRENGGGLGEVAQDLLSLFVSGNLGDYVSRDGSRPLEVAADGVANSQTVPLAVVVGDGTVSYAEVMAGILGATGRATVLGETTVGNVETLHGFDLPDGSSLWLATETFHPAADPSADWERDGIVPDVAVPSAWWDVTFDTDPVIPAAISALTGP